MNKYNKDDFFKHLEQEDIVSFLQNSSLPHIPIFSIIIVILQATSKTIFDPHKTYLHTQIHTYDFHKGTHFAPLSIPWNALWAELVKSH